MRLGDNNYMDTHGVGTNAGSMMSLERKRVSSASTNARNAKGMCLRGWVTGGTVLSTKRYIWRSLSLPIGNIWMIEISSGSSATWYDLEVQEQFLPQNLGVVHTLLGQQRHLLGGTCLCMWSKLRFFWAAAGEMSLCMKNFDWSFFKVLVQVVFLEVLFTDDWHQCACVN